MIAAAYARAGFRLEWTDLGRGRAGEFRVDGNNQSVFVECKKKREHTELVEFADTLLRQVATPLVRLLSKGNLNYFVRFEARRRITGMNFGDLIEYAAAQARSADRAESMYQDGVQVHTERICEQGQTVTGDLIRGLAKQHVPRHEWGIIRSTQTRREVDEIVRSGQLAAGRPRIEAYTDPIVVRVSAPEDVQGKLRGVENAIEQARKQLPQGTSGVIYVDAGVADYQAQEQVFAKAQSKIAEWHRSAGSRVVALVICNLFPTHSANLVPGWNVRAVGSRTSSVGPKLSGGFPLLGGLGLNDREQFVPGSWVELPPTRQP